MGHVLKDLMSGHLDQLETSKESEAVVISLSSRCKVWAEVMNE